MSAPLFALCLALCLSTGLSMESVKGADGYEVFPTMPGSRYKLTPIATTYAEALALCLSDGGSATLVVINSDEEAKVVRTLINRIPNLVRVGINDIEVEGRWVTVQGGLVSQSGFNKWEREEGPAYDPIANCAIFTRGDTYALYLCDTDQYAICEKPNV